MLVYSRIGELLDRNQYFAEIKYQQSEEIRVFSKPVNKKNG